MVVLYGCFGSLIWVFLRNDEIAVVCEMLDESFMKSVRKNLNGVISFRVSDVLYTLKNLDGGVDYVRLEDRKEEGND